MLLLRKKTKEVFLILQEFIALQLQITKDETIRLRGRGSSALQKREGKIKLNFPLNWIPNGE